MLKPVVVMALLVCLAQTGCQKHTNADILLSADETSLKNPLPPTASAIAAGETFYNSNGCAVCHGVNADGVGVSTAAMGADSIIRNWRDPAALNDFTDGYLFHVINQGKKRMPKYSMYASAEQSWQVVLFIRSIAGKRAPN